VLCAVVLSAAVVLQARAATPARTVSHHARVLISRLVLHSPCMHAAFRLAVSRLCCLPPAASLLCCLCMCGCVVSVCAGSAWDLMQQDAHCAADSGARFGTYPSHNASCLCVCAAGVVACSARVDPAAARSVLWSRCAPLSTLRAVSRTGM
jgi:hypothetical protein